MYGEGGGGLDTVLHDVSSAASITFTTKLYRGFIYARLFRIFYGIFTPLPQKYIDFKCSIKNSLVQHSTYFLTK